MDSDLSKSPREYHLIRTYGITEAQYDELEHAQDYRCNICKRPSSEFKTRLSVDHNHGTGEIRGLLCNHCNRRVVGRHTSGDLFRAAADHLDAHTGLFVPPKPRKKYRVTIKNGKRQLLPRPPKKVKQRKPLE